MRNDKLIPGLILVLIGVVILLDNFGYVDFHWENIWHLWPMFLVIAGVNLVFAHNRSPLATVIKIGVVVIGFILLLFGNFSNRLGFPVYSYSWHDHHDNNDKDDDDDDDDDDSTVTKTNGIVKVEGSSVYTEPYTADAKIAQLNIHGALATYTLNDTTGQLFKADTKEFFSKYELSHHNDGSTHVLDFNIKTKNGEHFNWHIDDDKSNSANLKLNINPIWDINVDAGALSKLNFDLNKFKIRTLKLSGGAASFDVKLGQPLESTNVVVSTGMSDVNIRIPQNAACTITTDSGLSSTSFDGFIKKDDDTYQTPDFDKAKNKIYISISGGLASFNVHRY